MVILQSLLAERRLCNVVQSQFRSDGVFALASTVSIQQSTSASKTPDGDLPFASGGCPEADAKRRDPNSLYYTML